MVLHLLHHLCGHHPWLLQAEASVQRIAKLEAELTKVQQRMNN